MCVHHGLTVGALGYRNRTDLPSGISARVKEWEPVPRDLEKLMALYFTVPWYKIDTLMPGKRINS